ncbi:SusC/RagA family TonB-linked outer membrane protein [Limibacterium fermenti]|jgi:TonB-linked SusC/RagA family outer membrane protein|uniref:SusC/RagA family TonB-linked outer membrane protein n=1 Tax=Limibacterium fermenti TaxID=3229863 RepID=UPI003A7759BF
MKKKFVLFLSLFLIGIGLATAQTRVRGTVVDEAGEPIIGATVTIKGVSQGTATDIDGNFSITAPEGGTLVVSYVGYQSQEVPVSANVRVTLVEDLKVLDEVVVTAFGLQRQKRELGYSTAQVNSEELIQARAVNAATSLQGKVAGLNVSSLDNGVLEDVKINLRGIRSLTGNNNPMLLLDGVPVGLNLLSTINPNDIENVNVLKGTSAAAIYGPDARNGVIIVTTKAGTKDGKPEITVSNSTQFSNISFLPKFQTQFGPGAYGEYIPYENWSWGPEYDGSEIVIGEPLEDGTEQKGIYSSIRNNRRDFFTTGVTVQNDISYATKGFFLSLQDANITGVVPDDESRRTGVRLNASQTYKKFTASFNTNYIYQKYNVFDNVGMDDYYEANNVGLNEGLMNLIFSTPAHIPLTSYKDFENNEFAKYNNYYNRYGINPYIALDTWRRKGLDQNMISSLDLKLAVTDWLDLNYRAAVTYTSQVSEHDQRRIPTTAYGAGRGLDPVPQAVENESYISNRLSSEFFANFHKTFGDFKVNAIGGTYVRDVLSRTTGVNASNLIIEDLFNVSGRPGELDGSSTELHTRMFSLYGSASVTFKNYATIEFTGRNDQTSVLDPSNNSFFYPGVNASFVLTDAVPALQSDAFNFLKLRGSWNKTGNADIEPYRLAATFSQYDDGGLTSQTPSGFPFSGIPGYSADQISYDRYLKPEFIESVEAGFEAGFFRNRINLDVTYYNQNNTNQIVNIRVPRPTGYNLAYINAASFRNFGFETQLKLSPLVDFEDVRVNFTANYSYNNSEVLSIYNDLDELSIGGYVMASNAAVKGQPAFVLNATDYKRDDQGRVIIDYATGYPIPDEVNKKFGRTMPMHMIGLNPSVQWKGLTLSALFEYKGGHYAFNMIGSDMAWTGVSEITGANHREHFVFPNSVYEDPDNPGTYIPNTNITTTGDAADFFTSDAYRSVASNFITSAASWRFRELSLTYDLPKSWLAKQDAIQSVSVGLIARNLVLWLPKTNVYSDPDFRGNQDFLSGANGNIAGISNATVNPPTRTIGGTVSIKF